MTIFNDSKYTRWYYVIINARLANPVTESSYSESHHIIPESFYIERTREGPAGWLEGDPESPDNKASLTGREHGLCHWLLTKMTDGVALIKCQQAFDMMGIGASHQGREMSRLTCRAYERNRIEISLIRSDRMKVSNPMNDPAARAKVGDSKRGKKRVGVFTEEQKRQMCIDRVGEGNGMYGKEHSAESKALQSKKASLMMWVNDGTISKRIYKADAQPYFDLGWLQGRHYVERGPRGPYKKKHTA
jgi:hypothetical protein